MIDGDRIYAFAIASCPGPSDIRSRAPKFWGAS